jgi:hypothetical protein
MDMAERLASGGIGATSSGMGSRSWVIEASSKAFSSSEMGFFLGLT